MNTYVDVILPLPLEGVFTYSVPSCLQGQVCKGVRVVVPLGKSKTYTGIILRVHDIQPAFEVRDIREILDDKPVLLPQQFALWEWIADYYMSPIGEVYKAALPAAMKQEDGYKPKTELCVALSEEYRNERALLIAKDMLKRSPKQLELLTGFLSMIMDEGDDDNYYQRSVTRDELFNTSHCSSANLKSLIDRKILYSFTREVRRINDGGDPMPERIKELSAVQQEAYNKLLLQMMRHKVVLLHGVTSSGKTEIYIHLIQKAVNEKKQVLYLLPEIALTVQITERLKRVFGNRLGIYHSKYSDAERAEIWQRQLSANPYDVILGVRSACFLPFQRLGLIIVDEEHEVSFKQQDPAPRYHARSVAIMMSQFAKEDVKVVLGTATPSLESYYNAHTGKYGLVSLTQRYQGIELPEIQVVDIRDLQRRKMMNGPFSPDLLVAVRNALSAGEQVILFQNRRGFAPMVECRVCGWVPKCKNCDVPLTLHKSSNMLTCHYCGQTYVIPGMCPNCESRELKGKGFGTEKIEDQIAAIFPEARVARMDLDTTRTRSAYERIINDFSSGRTNLLIGTQMVSKGLDFDKVSVVGILNADTMLNYPDFRAYEHAFMMMAQVSGRAGRKGRRGRVILQTKTPDLPVIRQVISNDFGAFYSQLLEERRDFHYPPFYRLINVYMKHRHESVVNSAGLELGSRLREVFGNRVLGPDKPAVARVKALHIRKIVLKLENGIDQKQVRLYLRQIQSQLLKDSRQGRESDKTLSNGQPPQTADSRLWRESDKTLSNGQPPQTADQRYAALQIYYDVDPL